MPDTILDAEDRKTKTPFPLLRRVLYCVMMIFLYMLTMIFKKLSLIYIKHIEQGPVHTIHSLLVIII